MSNEYKNNGRSWRDQQLNGFKVASKNTLLEQEQVMLDFVTKFPKVKWRWLGNNDNFRTICENIIVLDDKDYQGVILFGGKLYGLTTSRLVNIVRATIDNVNFAYVGFNRYGITKHDIDLDLPDSLEESLDVVMNYCDPMFKRLHSFAHVDGNHMVAAHPRDCYGLCR